MIVRISKGTFPLARLDEVEPLLADSESALRAALEAMPGLIHYFVRDRSSSGSAHQRERMGLDGTCARDDTPAGDARAASSA
jgi:hypothetical protein